MTASPTGAPAISYMRYSSPSQNKNNESIRRQTAARDAIVAKYGLRLDDSHRYVDPGVSGRSGKHRSDTKALGQLVNRFKAGLIAPGTWLLVENLDRLSREEVGVALPMLLDLINGGLVVCSCVPEIVFRHPVDSMNLIVGIMEMSRGHGESQRKHEMLTASWVGRRNKAAPERIATTVGPGWLRVEDGKFRLRDDRAAVVRQMFQWTADGHSLRSVVAKLNETVEPWGRSGKWSEGYVAYVLSSRSAIGEYQPTKGRTPIGEPVPGYYEPAVSENLFYQAQAAIAARTKGGFVGRGRVRAKATGKPLAPKAKRFRRFNMFEGLLRDARDGQPVRFKTYRHKGQTYSCFTVGEGQGKGNGAFVSFPVGVLVRGVLSCLTEIDPMEVLPQHDGAADDVMVYASKLREVEGRLADIQDRMNRAAGPVLDMLMVSAGKAAGEKAELVKRLGDAKAKATNTQAEAWGEIQGLAGYAESDDTDVLVRVRSALCRVVERGDVLFVRDGLRAIACVGLRFHGTTATRTVWVRYRARVKNQLVDVPEWSGWETMKADMPEGAELTDPDFRGLVEPMLRERCEKANWKEG